MKRNAGWQLCHVCAPVKSIHASSSTGRSNTIHASETIYIGTERTELFDSFRIRRNAAYTLVPSLDPLDYLPPVRRLP